MFLLGLDTLAQQAMPAKNSFSDPLSSNPPASYPKPFTFRNTGTLLLPITHICTLTGTVPLQCLPARREHQPYAHFPHLQAGVVMSQASLPDTQNPRLAYKWMPMQVNAFKNWSVAIKSEVSIWR